MFVTLEVWQRFGPKRPAELTPKVANIIPGSPTAFEGMPTDGLLAGIVCLLPTLAGSLRDELQTILQIYCHQDSMALAQRQKNRTMEQNRKSGDKSMHLEALYL